jgi:hypothetical protein
MYFSRFSEESPHEGLYDYLNNASKAHANSQNDRKKPDNVSN